MKYLFGASRLGSILFLITAIILISVPAVQGSTDFDLIMLHRQTIDTRAGVPVPPELAGQTRLAQPGDGLKLVQFAAPPVDADLDLLTGAGARIVQYVPENAYLIWAGPEEWRNLRKLRIQSPIIQFLGDYYPAYSVSPRLDISLENSQPVDVAIQFYNYGPQAMAAAKTLAAASLRIITPPREALNGLYINLRLSVPGTSLTEIAGLPGVVWINHYTPPQLRGERQDQIMAGNISGAAPYGPGYLDWLSNLSFPTSPSEYPIVDVVDDGFDNGDAVSPANSEFRLENNPSSASRVQYAVIAAGAAGITAPNGVDGHGNINCSIVGGYNNGVGTPANEDAELYHYGLGASPFGRLASTKIFTDGGSWGYPNEAEMVSNQYLAGARITSNSWGASVAGEYDDSSQSYDGWTRDARSGAGGNQEMLFVFAAGNSGSGSGTVGSPGTAKNVITVGASENYNLTGTDGCGITDAGADNLEDIIYFSSRGPCDDNRVKPDIVAPGTHIQGAASYDPAYNGTGVCDKYSPSGQTKYCLSSGTSHSTPGISGALSLIYNFLNRAYSIDTPSPALLKAYLIQAGRHLTGTDADDNLPSNNQGYGLVNLDFAFNQAADRYFIDQSIIFENSGESQRLTGTIPDSGEAFRAVLVWTDAPGPLFGNAYVNNLDLEVTVGGVLYRGNNFIKGISYSGGTADSRNNVEAVFLPAGTSGDITVTVRATAITGDGVPGNGDATDQDFALVIYNGDLYVTPDWDSLTIDSGDYNGDGTSDIAIFRPDSGLWAIRGISRLYYGASSALTVPADYDGNGTTDVAVFIPNTGLWAARGISRIYYGSAADIPIPGDYDGDGTCDPGIYRPDSGLWAIKGVTRIYFGTSTDIPAPGDYSGTGGRDIGIFRGSSGLWAIRNISRFYYGSGGDKLVPGDYNGDGTEESGIYRASSGLWAIRGVTRAYYGSLIYQQVPADYDGDQSTDIGLFRDEGGIWAAREITRVYFGTSGDIPVTR